MFLEGNYVSGYQGVYDFAKSTNPKDRKILDRLASHIERRHIMNGRYTPKPAGITDLTVDGRRIAYVAGNNIRIPDRTQGVAVYTTDGRLIYQEAPAPADFSITSRGLTIPLPKRNLHRPRRPPHHQTPHPLTLHPQTLLLTHRSQSYNKQKSYRQEFLMVAFL